jgi:hypothetical protein
MELAPMAGIQSLKGFGKVSKRAVFSITKLIQEKNILQL